MSQDTKVMGVIDGLNAKQIQAIDLLVAGYTVTDAAKEVGVERETISRWRTGDPFFMTILSERQEMLWQASSDKLRSNAVKAAARLEKLIEHQDPEIALKAIGLAYKAMAIYPKNGRAMRKSQGEVERDMHFRNL